MTAPATWAPRRSQSAVSTDGLHLPLRSDDSIALRLPELDPGCDPADGSVHLAVFVGGADSYHDRRQPIAGRYEYGAGHIRFTPAFGFVGGLDHVVRIRRGGEPPWLTEFRVSLSATPAAARVTHIYPSAEVLPENVLRFYVHFSVPMTPHLASDFVALRDASGRADRAAFVRFKQELWNADRTRLTILVDPGRIKRGITTDLELGPALLDGGRYGLTIDEGWPSADGLSAVRSFSKFFRVAEAIRDRPDVGRWSWRPPRPGSREPLEIAFDRPFDRHRLSGAIGVVAPDGTSIDGTSLVGENEMSWSFTPEEPWPLGDVRIAVDDALEDVAGNNLCELLDNYSNTQGTKDD